MFRLKDVNRARRRESAARTGHEPRRQVAAPIPLDPGRAQLETAATARTISPPQSARYQRLRPAVMIRCSTVTSRHDSFVVDDSTTMRAGSLLEPWATSAGASLRHPADERRLRGDVST
jgi:hypothetical protein